MVGSALRSGPQARTCGRTCAPPTSRGGGSACTTSRRWTSLRRSSRPTRSGAEIYCCPKRRGARRRSASLQSGTTRSRACCFQNTLIRVRAPELLVPFLHLHLYKDALTGEFAKAARGVGIHHLGAKTLSEWEIHLPPRDEQRRIVEIVDSYFTRLDDVVATVSKHVVVDRFSGRIACLRKSILKSAFSEGLSRSLLNFAGSRLPVSSANVTPLQQLRRRAGPARRGRPPGTAEYCRSR